MAFPSSLALQDVAEWAIQSLSTSELANTVDFVMAATELARLPGAIHVYDDPYLILQLSSGYQGYAFAHPGEVHPNVFQEIVGRRVGDISLDMEAPVLAAFVDAVCESRRPRASAEVRLIGNSAAKSNRRARAIVEELAPTLGSKVGIVGGIEDIVLNVTGITDKLQIADFHLAGTEIGGVSVGSDYEAVLEWCDFAIVTGNTLKTNTLSPAVNILKRRGIRAVLYAMTGHNVAAVLADSLPFAAVTSETFPFYWYAGTSSRMRIFRKGEG